MLVRSLLYLTQPESRANGHPHSASCRLETEHGQQGRWRIWWCHQQTCFGAQRQLYLGLVTMATDLSVFGSKLHPHVKDLSTNPVIRNGFIPGSQCSLSKIYVSSSDTSANIEKKKVGVRSGVLRMIMSAHSQQICVTYPKSSPILGINLNILFTVQALYCDP